MARDIQAEIQQTKQSQERSEREGTKLVGQFQKIEADIKQLEQKVKELTARGDSQVAAKIEAELKEKRREKERTEKEMNALSDEVAHLEAQLRDLRKRNNESRKDVDEAAKHATSGDSIKRATQVITEREKEIERMDRECKDLRSQLRKYASSSWG